MRNNSHYFNIYRGVFNLFTALIFCFLLVACSYKQPQQILTPDASEKHTGNVVNINVASAGELEKLPNIGAKLAVRIVEHRARHGPFRRAEHLMLVDGISEERFFQIQKLITTD